MNLVLLASLLCFLVNASLYNPHVPEGSPWFEGWYTRISRTTSGISFGIIVGYYPQASAMAAPSSYVALIVDHGQGEAQTFEVYPRSISVLSNGSAPTQNPTIDGEPNFTVTDEEGDTIEMVHCGSKHYVRMIFPTKNVSFEARLSNPEPWDDSSWGPEGWAGKLPFVGLHWFVYSVRSSASFKFSSSLGTVSGTGTAHQEKNWGKAFPREWFWAEAVGENSSIVLAGGSAPLGPVTVPNAFLVGLRKGGKTWNVHPQDPALFSPSSDACNGSFSLKAETALHSLKVDIHIDPSSGGGLFKVAGPTSTGFKADSVESYRAKIVVELWSRGIFGNKLEAKETFFNSGMEFGGDARCKIIPQKPKRVRQELRTLSALEREHVFAALDVMKHVSGDRGRELYGARFASYDELVAQHLKASAQRPCDAAHLGPSFATYHRAFTLRFEESLLSIDARIKALPYWDYNIEGAMKEPRNSEIWTWFGSSEGDANHGNAVRDGRFAHWKVRSAAADISNLTNPYGLLRSPWNVNPSPYITRYRYSCGSETIFKTSVWDMCLKAPLYMGWYACIDPMVHTWAHSFIGGIWDTESNASRILCYVENALIVPDAWGRGCFKCDRNCKEGDTCSCLKSSDPGCMEDKFYSGQKTPVYGDFADAWASPNDPIFFFHHANVDRSLMTWQQHHADQAPHYNMPSASVPCHGHGLNDIIAPDVPFEGSLLGFEERGRLLTNADLIAADGLSDTSLYTYDSLLNGATFV